VIELKTVLAVKSFVFSLFEAPGGKMRSSPGPAPPMAPSQLPPSDQLWLLLSSPDQVSVEATAPAAQAKKTTARTAWSRRRITASFAGSYGGNPDTLNLTRVRAGVEGHGFHGRVMCTP
jgi:hypothetical protein